MIISTAKADLERDWVYDLAGNLDLRLAVDVGAGAGQMTRRIRGLGDDHMRVIAYEPFPGNLAYFEEATSDLTGVSLVPKAVSDRVGHSVLYVRKTVTGHEPGWEEMEGYSSIGRLPVGRRTRLAYELKRFRQRDKFLRVTTTTLDTELGDQVVDFLKIDVQGAEYLVLAGARRLLAEHRIRLVYAEWFGDQGVLDLLGSSGYRLYDSHYVGFGELTIFEAHGFRRLGAIPLSTGRPAWDMVYMGDDDVTPILQDLNSGGLVVQTDLVAIPESDREVVNLFSAQFD